MRKYDKYKESGVEWIGEVPEKWKTLRLASLGLFSKGGGFSKSDLKRSGISAILYGDIYTKYQFKITDSPRYISREVASKSVPVFKGDLLFTGSGETKEDIGKCVAYDSDRLVVAGGDVIILRQKKMDSAYLSYCMSSVLAKGEIAKSSKGEIIVHTYASKLKEIRVPAPFTLVEQTAIATFLDQKTAQIDRAIAQKERLIELLRERKQIVIQQAVTRGLDPTVKMKDSGVEWIGEIPAHWTVSKLKYYTNKIVDGTHFTPTYVDTGIPFLRVTDISNPLQKTIDWDNVKFIPEKEHLQLIKRANPEKGDVLLSKNGTIGITRVIDWNNEFSFFVSLCLIKLTSDVNPYYFCQLFDSPLVDQQITFGSSRTSVTNLHLEKIKELLVILPPIEEQNDLSSYMKSINDSFNSALLNQQNQIAKLKEYRTVLIDAAVTGKVRVS